MITEQLYISNHFGLHTNEFQQNLIIVYYLFFIIVITNVSPSITDHPFF